MVSTCVCLKWSQNLTWVKIPGRLNILSHEAEVATNPWINKIQKNMTCNDLLGDGFGMANLGSTLIDGWSTVVFTSVVPDVRLTACLSKGYAKLGRHFPPLLYSWIVSFSRQRKRKEKKRMHTAEEKVAQQGLYSVQNLTAAFYFEINNNIIASTTSDGFN